MKNMRQVLIVAWMILFLTPLTALAGDDQPLLSEVSTQLYAEGWVESQDANVIVSVNAAVNTAGLGALRDSIQAHLQQIAKGDWKITQFDRQRDSAGLERLMVQAEARIPSDQLTAIYDSAKKISKPGEQFDIASMDFTPSRAAYEKTANTVRKTIYQLANEELARLNEFNQDYPYQISRIQFINPNQPLPQSDRKMLTSEAMMASAAPNVAVSQQVQMTAIVVFAREIEKETE